mgnify:CR=1 FL=1
MRDKILDKKAYKVTTQIIIGAIRIVEIILALLILSGVVLSIFDIAFTGKFISLGFQYGYFNGMEDIYEYSKNDEIIIFGHILETYKYVFVRWEEGEGKPEKPEIKPINAEGVQILDYSEKAVAVIGDTKPIKDQLKALGGRFNFRLSCGPGWIFKADMKDELNKLFS